MHRTQSWDIGVVLEGRVLLKLDGGDEREIGQGEVVVQRGTNHVCYGIFPSLWAFWSRVLTVLQAWTNSFPDVCRMLFVLVPSVPIKDRATGGDLEITDTRHLTSEEGAQEVIAKMMAHMAAKQGQ